MAEVWHNVAQTDGIICPWIRLWHDIFAGRFPLLALDHWPAVNLLVWTPSLPNTKIHPGNPRKREWVDYMGGECMKCGYSTCVQALTFHHINPKLKSFFLTSGGARGEARGDQKRTAGKTKLQIYQELDKCALLCGNCHDELHAGLWNIKEISKPLKPEQQELLLFYVA